MCLNRSELVLDCVINGSEFGKFFCYRKKFEYCAPSNNVERQLIRWVEKWGSHLVRRESRAHVSDERFIHAREFQFLIAC